MLPENHSVPRFPSSCSCIALIASEAAGASYLLAVLEEDVSCHGLGALVSLPFFRDPARQ